MSEQQAAATAVDPIENLTDEQFRQYRSTGELPKAEPAEAATVDAQEQTESEAQTESAGESETPNLEEQEQPRKPKNAAQRIAQLESAIEAEWAKDDPDVVRIGQLNATIDKINGRPKRKSEAAPPQANVETKPNQQPQNYAEWEQQFNADKWIEEYAKANPDASYEKANAAMFSHMITVRDQFKSFEQQVQAQRQALESQVNEAKERYEDFDEIKDEFLGKVLGPNGTPLIPVPVLSLINDSPRMADVLYTIGSDENELNKFVKMAQQKPNDAIRYIARVESLIDEEFEKQTGNAGQSGKAPEKRQTQAPKPVTPVGGSASRGFDVNDESLSDDEWMRQRRAQLSKR
ncbi:MAG TPA: hypothetical protein VIY48_20160 [Candidatus Paceibacterota bacterium]